MKTIYKYKLKELTTQTITMPKGYEILSVQVQHGVICLWAIVTESNEPEDVTINVHGTGHPVTSNNLTYISTIQMLDGDLILFVFKEDK